MSRFFIDRPIFASVLSIVIVLGGIICMVGQPVAQYPQVAPPTVMVEAVYPGASAQTVALSVAAPIEQQLSGVKGLLYYQSQCSNDGKLRTTITFEIGTDLELAAVEVQNRIQKAQSSLPQEVARQGLTITKKSTDVLMLITLNSSDPRYDDLFLSNYATINILDALKRIDGVGDASTFGAGDYSMRIWLNPDRLAAKRMTVSDVAGAVREQNGLYAAGRIGQRPNPAGGDLTMTVAAPGRLSEPAEFNRIIVRANPDGSMVRVGDVGRAELGGLSYDLFARQDGKATTLVIVYLQPGANALETAARVQREMQSIAGMLPRGITHDVPLDTTRFVRISIREVVQTFIEAVVLVLLVVFLFLQSFRATLVPLLAVPVSIIGTFIGMQAMGFSINSLTLFGMVLAIGIVVDDAIIVVENVQRIMAEDRLDARAATIRAMEQVTGPVIATTLVLAAVFVPVVFIGGLTGVMYKQFAVTIAISVVISSLVALTLSPALCGLLLRSGSQRPAGGFFALFNRLLDRLTAAYGKSVRVTIRAGLFSAAVFGVLVWATLGLFRKVPGGFVPDEDQGYIFGAVLMPNGATLDRTDRFCRKVEEYFLAQPEVRSVVVLGGQNVFAAAASNDSAQLFVILKDWSQRKDPRQHAQEVIRRANLHFAGEKEAVVMAFNPPAVAGLGTRSGFEFQLQNRGGDVRQLAQTTGAFVAALRKRPEISGVAIPLSVAQPQLSIQADRERIAAMGVPVSDVFNTLQAFWGQLYVNDFDKFGRIWKVNIQAEPQFRARPEDLAKIHVRGPENQMISLAGIVTSRFEAGPNVVSRFNGFTSVTLTGAPALGYSTGEAMGALRETARQHLPEGFAYEWSGASLQEVNAGNQAPFVMAFGLVVVFLVLAAQYEKWSLPLAVLLAVPLGLFGAIVAVWMRGLNNDIYFQIGLLTLVALSTKNAILIVEFCAELRKTGKSIVESAVEAARLRFRPILMTSLTFILGVMPLVLSTGAGAGARRSIGTGVMGGMIAATFLAIFLVPLFFVVVEGASLKLTRRSPHEAPAESATVTP